MSTVMCHHYGPIFYNHRQWDMSQTSLRICELLCAFMHIHNLLCVGELSGCVMSTCVLNLCLWFSWFFSYDFRSCAKRITRSGSLMTIKSRKLMGKRERQTQRSRAHILPLEVASGGKSVGSRSTSDFT